MTMHYPAVRGSMRIPPLAEAVGLPERNVGEIRSGKRDIHSPGITVESATECQMDASVKIYVRESLCQSSSSKTSEQEN
jgi:hypothetical protein